MKKSMIPAFIFISFMLMPSSCNSDENSNRGYENLREKMVAEQMVSRGIKEKRILASMRAVPRHLFVPEEVRNKAYDDTPLPIGFGQTISQPYIVALMTELAGVEKESRVLEIGTGSGYQAAVLAELSGRVYSIEIIKDLALRAEKTLKDLGYENVLVKAGDGYLGWPEHAPYDVIIVTCASEEVPAPLLDQLAEGGRLVIPVGPRFPYQYLKVFEKNGDNIKEEDIISVRFVPMTGLVENR